MIPHSLVLAQAALESGWGTSRFAQEANNLFGVWTWNPKEGLPPRRKSKGASHFVRKYEDLRASVRSYLFNINVGHAYRDLRRSRAAMREQNQDIDVMQLAAELESYSERGEQYVEEVRIMIEYNRLALLTHAELAPDDQSLASVTNHGWLNQ
ncbi:MAG: glucosaminidase domain-containing protein [Gammaproteobacteria bacterium]|nr:glucosaminidase domain-containing protein [Gammaproteobacteria bacterium]